MGFLERLEKAIEDRLEPLGDHPYEHALALWRLLVAHPKPGGFCPNRLSAPAALNEETLEGLAERIQERGFALPFPLHQTAGPLAVSYSVGPDAPEARVLVVVRSGPSAGKVGLGSDRLVIGRGDDVDLRLGDPSVSRRHCSLNARPPLAGGDLGGGDARLELVDLSSRLGVTVDGQKVSEVTLEDGQRFRLGEHEVQAYRL